MIPNVAFATGDTVISGAKTQVYDWLDGIKTWIQPAPCSLGDISARWFEKLCPIYVGLKALSARYRKPYGLWYWTTRPPFAQFGRRNLKVTCQVVFHSQDDVITDDC